MITSEAELEDRLSEPNEADCEAMAALQGPLLLLGAGGKMGPSLALRARRAAERAGVGVRIIAVSRYSDASVRAGLEAAGIEVISADLLEPGALESLPDAPHVIYMAAKKFGSMGNEPQTWAMNAYLPGRVAERYREARIVAFSSGNIYPLLPVASGGATEQTPAGPVGEYAQSVLARERVFEHFSRTNGTPLALLRLNYAVELRYGVLLDIGMQVFAHQPVDVTMGSVNVIWQGDANSICLRSFGLCSVPPTVLNLTGPETLSVRQIATAFGRQWGMEPVFTGTESATALLNNASACHRQFGYPTVSPAELIEWTAAWIQQDGARHGKPTHFATRDGKF